MKSPDKCIIAMKTQLSSLIILNVKVQVNEIARSGLAKVEGTEQISDAVMSHNFCLHGAALPLSSQKSFRRRLKSSSLS